MERHREEGRKKGLEKRKEKDNQQAGATKAGIHDLMSQFIMGRERNERPTGGQNIGKGKMSGMEGDKYRKGRSENLKKEHRDCNMNTKEVGHSGNIGGE